MEGESGGLQERQRREAKVLMLYAAWFAGTAETVERLSVPNDKSDGALGKIGAHGLLVLREKSGVTCALEPEVSLAVSRCEAKALDDWSLFPASCAHRAMLGEGDGGSGAGVSLGCVAQPFSILATAKAAGSGSNVWRKLDVTPLVSKDSHHNTGLLLPLPSKKYDVAHGPIKTLITALSLEPLVAAFQSPLCTRQTVSAQYNGDALLANPLVYFISSISFVSFTPQAPPQKSALHIHLICVPATRV